MSYKPQIRTVAQGGTGLATLTGIPLGSGTSNFSNISFTDKTSFTPHILFGGGETGQAFNYNVGYYSQIGNIVIFQSVTSFSSIGSSTGAATYTLPVAASSATNFFQSIFATLKTGSFGLNTFNLYIQSNSGSTSSVIYGNTYNSGTVVQLQDANFNNASLIQVSGIYLTS
jgi:hypothetical protein